MHHYHDKCSGLFPNSSGNESCECPCHACCQIPQIDLHNEDCPLGDTI